MNIGVFFGGKSPEHDVSIITGELIISQLKKDGHAVTPVYLGKNGEWYCHEKLGSLKFLQDENLENTLKDFEKISLDLQKSRGKMVFKKTGKILSSEEIVIDLAFPAFHGSNGEDGTIQGLFELLNIPYVGCDVPSSAIAFDKILTKQHYIANNFPTTKFITFNKKDWGEKKEELFSKIKTDLKFPLFVKPPTLGSSIGISKAKDEKELEFGIEVALHYGDNVLIEEGVANVADLTCCLIGNEEPQASLVQEAKFENDLFDFEKKYLDDGGAQLGNAESSLVIPAKINEEDTKKIQDMSVEIYKSVGCCGIARIDFLYNKDTREIFANEINPLPGTVYHHLWKASGMELSELLENLIKFAKERHEKKQQIKYTFDSKIMNFANSIKLQIKNK